MKNEFDKELKNIEDELLNLKTASEYTSIKSTNYNNSWQVSTGLYQITYDNYGDIATIAFLGDVETEFSPPDLRTPNGNKQIIEVVTTDPDGTIYTTNLTLISSQPVLSVVRL
ncbi:MAG: hypothetical protein J6Z11_12355 [Candidatus Riflebacteria bacterium]|nr:hypothetical protein [Candidatus Riflebacteria bacterium]